MSVTTRLDRIRGCFLGLAIGDALGAPLEGLSPQQIRAHYGVVTDFVDGSRAWKRKPNRRRLPGLYTDDTQQALAITDVLLSCGRLDVDRLAEIYLELASTDNGHDGAHRGVGKSFRQVLIDLKRGVSPKATGQPSVGIGAAMRIAPIGLYYADDPEGLFDAVLAAGLMTHKDVRSIAGAFAVAYAIGRLVNGEARTAGFVLRLAADVAKAETRMAAEFAGSVRSLDVHGRSLSSSIANVESLLEMPRDRALVALLDQANRQAPDSPIRRVTQGFPPALIPTCLYLLITSESLEDALIDVVNLGGDADTAGAILGAMLGASIGTSTLPARWIDGLHNSDGILIRAEAVDRRSTEGLTIPDLVAREHELTAKEAANRDGLIPPPPGGDLGVNRRI